MKRAWFFAALVIGGLSSISLGATYGGGSGTTEDPYQIWTAEQMNTIGVNSGDWASCFKLMADISLYNYSGTQYKIIGNATTKFTGTFDGCGHVISYLRYSNTSTVTTYFGLFGYTSSAVIKNLGLTNVAVYVSGKYVGGLIGRQDSGTVLNCYSSGIVNCSKYTYSVTGGLVGLQVEGTVFNCYTAGSVRSTSTATSAQTYSYAGGLVGMCVNGIITDCHSTTISVYASAAAAMYASNSFCYAGGLVGFNSGSITGSHCTGTVTSEASSPTTTTGTSSESYAGGLTGFDTGIITDSYSTGSATSNSKSAYPTATAGGLAGTLSEGSISRCSSTGTATAASISYYESYSYAGGLIGYSNGTISNCYSMGASSSTSMYTGSYAYAGGLVGCSNLAVEKCFSTGTVSVSGNAASYHGGLIGYIESGSVTDSFWDTQTSSRTASAGGAGKTTAQMKTLLTYTSAGWDFMNETANGTNDYWRMCVDGVDYPQLNWQSIDSDFACPDGVNVEDLDYFVGQWLMSNCTSNNNYCGGVDINLSGIVNLVDFSAFAEHWLEGV
ncbi:MAG: hypothetical protein FJ263_11030 [Planctomycetes bacterium]|nr:hypothetical protein [Planctomycetota bacterium]